MTPKIICYPRFCLMTNDVGDNVIISKTTIVGFFSILFFMTIVPCLAVYVWLVSVNVNNLLLHYSFLKKNKLECKDTL